MNQFQALLSLALKKRGAAGPPDSQPEKQDQPQPGEEDSDVTQKLAARLARPVLGRTLTKQEKNVAGPVVHYAFGTITGGVYGSAAELTPQVTAGFGLLFAVALWLAADETAVPLFGLSKSPLQYPLSSHASALGAHAVYGVITELLRRTFRGLL